MTDEILLADIGAFIPFPSILLDEQMPSLKDTEWRLLCVVVRQTLGWQSGKGRKRRDWMSQKQLMARTGRNSAALSAALDGLVRKNLVECCNARGEPLVTPRQRRNQRGRVYFALTLSRFTALSPDAVTEEAPAEAADTPTTRIYSGWAKASEIAHRLSYAQKSEVQKAKWTKETEEQKKNYK